jgi:glycosyltransferase involved in cell wall biosynthesis
MIWHVAHDTDVIPGSRMHGRNPLRQLLETRSASYGIRHAKHIVTQTEHQARLLKLHYNRDPDAIIPNFQPEPREIIDKAGPFSVVWIASLKPWKQPEVFVRLARELRDLRHVRFIVVGAKSADRDWDRALMRGIESTPNLEYIGPRTQSEVNQLLARAHLLVNTSLAEGFPNTFIQAWMREVPVVTLQIDPDGVMAGKAIGICAGSEEGLAQAVRMFASNAMQRAEYGHRAREHAMQRHSLRNVQLLARLMDTGSVDLPRGVELAGGLF